MGEGGIMFRNKERIDFLINQVLPVGKSNIKTLVVHGDSSEQLKEGVRIRTLCGLGDEYISSSIDKYPFLNITFYEPQITCLRCLSVLKKRKGR